MNVHRLLVCCILAAILAGCGSSAARPAPKPIAIIGGDPITPQTLRSYVSYAASYYTVRYAGAKPTKRLCPQRWAACTRLTNQVLKRLLQEYAVFHYAARHHITLSASDRRRVEAQLSALRALGTTPAQLIASHKVTVPFLRHLLQTEMLIRKVEAQVVPAVKQSGFGFRLRTFAIPIAPGGHGLHAYQKAVDLATDGKPVPRKAIVRTSWVPRSRLAANLRQPVEAAKPGDFVGPFRTTTGYLVIEVLRRGPHELSTKARQRREAHAFRIWLATEVTRLKPQCFQTGGKTRVCP